MFSVSLIIPIFMGLGAWALADGAARNASSHNNFPEVLGLGIVVLALVASPVPYLFRWDWKAKYFGAGFLCLATGSILGLYPILCLALFSSLPLVLRLSVALIQAAIIAKWCYRFVEIYKKIAEDRALFQCIYAEEGEAVYYLQQADKHLIDRKLKFSQLPSSGTFLLALLIAFSLVPFAFPVARLIGLPFTHIFLAIAAAPLTLMFLGLSTKMWLVYYFYPSKIMRETHKPVYVDISSQPCKHFAQP
jgi:hypothetical protein